MSALNVELGDRSYPIYIRDNALYDASIYQSHIQSKKVIILTNETVAPLYLEPLELKLEDYAVQSIVIPDGEQYKTLNQLEAVIGQMLQMGCSRDTTLIALGGGVVGDLCGFVAATYQRGIPFIQVPTTLLAQVDSSVGGKTAVNHSFGKNMIGAFYQPKAVVIDSTTLKTLPFREFAAGMAEVIKYGIIYDTTFFNWLENNVTSLKKLDSASIQYAVRRCCEIKAEIVSKDETEKGLRALLNLGHTFGHAIEAEMGYGVWLHGEAVSAGMVIACKVAEQLNWMSVSETRRVTELLKAFELPTQGPNQMKYEEYLKHMIHDKKVEAGSIRYIIPKRIGEAVITDTIPTKLLKSILG